MVVPHDAFEETNEKRIGQGSGAPSRRADCFGLCKFGGGGGRAKLVLVESGGALFWLEHGFGGVDCAMATPPAHEVVLLVNGTPAECCIADGHSPCAKAAGNPQELGDPPWADGTMTTYAVTGQVQICNVKIVEDSLLPCACDTLGRGNVTFALSKLLKTFWCHFRVMPRGGVRSNLHRQNC